MRFTTEALADLPTASFEAPCAACLRARGLCRFCARSILPQIAQPFWYALVGRVLVEQRKRQSVNAPDPKAERIKARKARKQAKRIAALVSGQFAPARQTRLASVA